MVNQHKQVPDIFIHDPDEDGRFIVEVSIPTGPRTRRVIEFDAADKEDADGLAKSLLQRAQRPCEGDALDAVLGIGLLDEGGAG